MRPGAEPAEEDYFQGELANVMKRSVGVAGEGARQRGWAWRRENSDCVGWWPGRYVDARGVRGRWRDGARGGSVDGGVQRSWDQGYRQGRQEGNMRRIAMGTYG